MSSTTITPLALLATVLLIAQLGTAALAAPVITWASDPVLPDETVVLLGGGFGTSATVEAARLEDSKAGVPGAVTSLKVTDWQGLPVLQASDHSLKAVIPATWKPGAYACRVREGADTSNVVIANRPDPWWLQGDRGNTASPGGWVRIFGKCLGMGGPVQVCLKTAQGAPVLLTPQQADTWSLTVDLPTDFRPGDYTVSVHNGWGGPATWRAAGAISVVIPPPAKTEVFNVKDFGPDSNKAVRAALAKVKANGGGVVYFPRGRYQIKGELDLPPNTILRGEKMELVSLYWPDMANPPDQLIGGPKFGLEDLTIYCQNHKNVVADQPDSDGTFLHHVRIRANAFFMFEEPGKEFRGRKAPASNKSCGAAIMLKGHNFSITDCDIYATNYALHIYKAKTGIIARNRFLYGGRGYSIENTDRLIFEDNLVQGNNLTSIGDDITTFWTNYCRNIYYAHNHICQIFGADREMMTLDAGGGAYFGKIASCKGTHVTLAADPTYKDYAPHPHTDWTGAAFMILDGTGAGQWRRVVKNQGRQWEIDRPWLIPPDSTSVISIAPHRGRNLFIGNTFEDGGAFQLYGAALDTIVAENTGARMDGFFAWGLNPHGWGWQPVWFCQFLDNEITEGNGYGYRSAFMGAFTSNNNATYSGPLARCCIFRRDVCDNNSHFRLGGTLEDGLIEHCTVKNADVGIDVRQPAHDVLLRNNTFSNVTTPLTGDGLASAKVLPKPGRD